MIRRFSLVRKRPELSRDEFLDRWTGEHVELAKRLAGLRGYVIHILDGPSPPYDGIAVTTFATREDAERAFADPELAEGLARTRDEFAASVEVFFAEEHVIVEEEEMSSTDRGRKRSLEVTGGPAQAAARSMLRAMGWTTEDLQLPQAGVAATWNRVTPCNMHLDELAEAAADELRSLRVLPLVFHTISVSDGIAMGTEGMSASLPSRDWIADSVELVVHAERMDGLFAIAGCDKTLPGMMMAMIRLDLPAVFAYGGSIRPGCFRGRDVSIQDVYEAIGAHATGRMTLEELTELECVALPARAPARACTPRTRWRASPRRSA